MITDNSLILSNTLKSAQAEIQTILNVQVTEAVRFAESSRKRTYGVAQQLLCLGRILLAEDNRTAFANLLASKKIKTRTGTNDWSYVILLAIPDVNTWKNRAGALRALDRFCNEDDSGQAAEFIDAFTIQSLKKRIGDDALSKAIGDSQARRLDGLALVDRLQNRDRDESTEADFLSAAKSAEVLDVDALKLADPKTEFVMIWAQVVSGKVVPMGVIDKSEAAARKAAIAAGRLIRKTPTVAEISYVIEDKKGDLIMGDEVGSTSAPEVIVPESAYIEQESKS